MDTLPTAYSSSSSSPSSPSSSGGEEVGSSCSADFRVISVTPAAASMPAPLQTWVDGAMARGLCFSDSVRENEAFRNPAILGKLVTYCGLSEHGTHFEVEEDARLGKHDFYDAIASVQANGSS